MMKPMWVRSALAVVAAAFALAAVAAVRRSPCGCCLRAPEAAGAGVLGASFWPRLAATVLPFGVLVGVVALIYFGPPVRRPRDDRPATLPAGSAT